LIGIRAGEKLHEILIPKDEAYRTLEFHHMYVVQPDFAWWHNGHLKGGKKVKDDFEYSSHNNEHYLSGEELLELIGKPLAQAAERSTY
jgi:UDP-N-acetylglucosamine 4,6-dehydratase